MRFIESPPNKYREFLWKYIMVLDGRYCVAYQNIFDRAREGDSVVQRIKEQMRLYIKLSSRTQFEFLGQHVEVHYNTWYDKYFWVVGNSPERFSGPCLYFEKAEDCIQDAKKEIEIGLYMSRLVGVK